ncbi:hypothetical protein [Streptomyces tirandamycinicus]|uniref:hypothetical protein n=1 Tax=Streptomyces tirandamycinicus TaxID=2174846 RepID=UPI00142E2EC1|nr:hypothetical protein [Streptomyces tirandamycinicus]
MTAARIPAAGRPARRAAGRHAVRALKALLFLGGLVLLGFALGGQAHAVERPGEPSAVSQAGSAGPVRQLRGDAAPVAAEAVDRTARPAADRVVREVRPVAEPVVPDVAEDVDEVRPVAGLVEQDVDAVRRVAGPVVREVRPVAGLVAEQAARPVFGAASVTGTVTRTVTQTVTQPAGRTVGEAAAEATESLGGVAGTLSAGVSAGPWQAPGQGRPGEDLLPVPVPVLSGGDVWDVAQGRVPPGLRPGDPPAAEAVHEEAAGTDEGRSGPVKVGQFRPAHDTPPPAGAAHHGRSQVLRGGVGDQPHPGHPGRSPAAPYGAAVLQTAGDSHTPRPGDQPAAWFQGAPVRALPPGSGLPEADSGVCDRLREIPEFPG